MVFVFLFMCLVAGSVALWVVTAAKRREQRRDTALGQIAAHLGGESQGGSAFGKIDGVPIVVRFGTRGSGSDTQPWTEIDVEVPRAYPLAIYIRRHAWLDQGRIERGDMIDVQLGDPEFDRAFLVEAAPEDVVRALLDATTRSFLSAHDRAELETIVEGELRYLRFAVPGWLEDLAAVTPAIHQVARIGARVRTAYADVDRPAPAQAGGSPYRSELADQPARDASAARAAEVAALEAIRAARAGRQKVMVVALMVGIAIVWLVLVTR